MQLMHFRHLLICFWIFDVCVCVKACGIIRFSYFFNQLRNAANFRAQVHPSSHEQTFFLLQHPATFFRSILLAIKMCELGDEAGKIF